MRPRPGSLALLFLLVLPTFARATPAAFDGAWVELAPPQRQSHVLAVDGARDRLLVFGGASLLGSSPGAWSRRLAGPGDWQPDPGPGPQPAALTDAQSFADPARDRLVVVGPSATSIGTIALARDEWNDRSAVHWPASAAGTGIAFDPSRNRLLCFGGQTPCSAPLDIHMCPHDTLWAISLAGHGTFAPLAATGPAPAPRTGAVAIYDPTRDRVIVFGGVDASRTPLTDLWALDLSPAPHWEALAVSGTPPPGGRFVGYDAALDQALFFTSYTAAPPLALWTLSLSGAPVWAHAAPGGVPPAPGFGSAVTLDVARHRLLVNGGALGAGETRELPLGPGASWNIVEAPPPGREHYASAYDAAGDRTLVFGGFRFANYTFTSFNDVWARAYGAQEHWEALAPSGVPPAPRYGPSAAMDPIARRMIVFGGQAETFRASDTWELALDPVPAWGPLAEAGPHPSARALATMVYDAAARRMVLFGGGNDGSPDTAYGDTWSLSLEGEPTWSSLSPTGTPPSPRHGALGMYDSRRHRMLVLGGYEAADNADQLWSLSLEGAPAWSALIAANDPGHLVWEAATYDSAQDRIVALGPGATATDVWALDLGGAHVWSPLSVSGSRPSGRFAESGFFDPRRNRLLPFGGFLPGQGSSQYANDLWALDLLGPGTTGVPPTHPGAALALAAPWPNPALRDWSVAFALPASAPVRIELLDVAGRRLAARDLGSLSAGPHSVRMTRPSPLRSGVYFVRVTQGAESAAVPVTIAK